MFQKCDVFEDFV